MSGTLHLLTFESGTANANITAATAGLLYVVYNNTDVSSSGNAGCIFATGAATRGTLGVRTTPAASQSYLSVGMSESGRRWVARRRLMWALNPSASTALITLKPASGFTGSLYLNTGGTVTPYVGTNAYSAGTSTWARTAGQDIWVEYFILLESATGAGDGQVGYNVTDRSGTQLATYSSPTTLSTGSIATNLPTQYRSYAPTTALMASGTDDQDDLAVQQLDSGWIGLPSTPLVVNQTSAQTVTADFRTSTGVAPLSFTIAFTSGVDHTSGILQPVSGLFSIPRDSTTDSTYTVTVTDSASTVGTGTVSVPAQTATTDALRVRTRAGGVLI